MELDAWPVVYCMEAIKFSIALKVFHTPAFKVYSFALSWVESPTLSAYEQGYPKLDSKSPPPPFLPHLPPLSSTVLKLPKIP